MNRRDFIKIGGLGFLTVLTGVGGLDVLANLPVEVATQGKVYRGTHDGKIFVSEDGSQTWRLHANFGSGCSIRRFSAGANSQVHVLVGYQKYTFQLTLSSNGKFWKSNTSTSPV